MSSGIAAVVFDLDGTLIDSMGLVYQAYAHAVQPYLGAVSDEVLRRAMGGPPERIFEQLLADSAHVSAAQARLDAFAATAWQRIEPYPGMIAALDELRTCGCRLGIWTGRERASTEWLLAKHEIAPRIHATVCGDDLPTHKPDPAGLHEVLRQLGVNPGSAMYVGDTETDLRAGVAAGVRTVLIRHGLPVDRVLAAKAGAVVDTPSDAYRFLRTQLQR